jgi:hypothetical protein
LCCTNNSHIYYNIYFIARTAARARQSSQQLALTESVRGRTAVAIVAGEWKAEFKRDADNACLQLVNLLIEVRSVFFFLSSLPLVIYGFFFCRKKQYSCVIVIVFYLLNNILKDKQQRI